MILRSLLPVFLVCVVSAAFCYPGNFYIGDRAGEIEDGRVKSGRRVIARLHFDTFYRAIHKGLDIYTKPGSRPIRTDRDVYPFRSEISLLWALGGSVEFSTKEKEKFIEHSSALFIQSS